MVTPETVVARSMPSCARNPPSSRACSSAVRSATVAARQCWTSLSPSNTPMVISVLPTSSASSMGSSYQSRPTSSAGAEWVRAPTARKSTPLEATRRALARVIPPDASVRARPAAMATALDMASRPMLSSSSSSQPASSAWATSSSVSTSTSSGRPGPAGRADVVVLDQQGVAEAHAVVLAAAGADRVLGELAEAGEGLAGVADDRAGALDRRHERRGERGHAGEVAEQVQQRPLRRQHDPGRPGDAAERAAGGDRLAVLQLRLEGRRLEVEPAGDLGKGDLHGGQPGDHAGCPRGQHRGRVRVEQRAGGVPGRQVLVEGDPDSGPERLRGDTLPDHRRTTSAAGTGTRATSARPPAPPRTTCRTRQASTGPGYSRRWWAPRDSSRASAILASSPPSCSRLAVSQ